MSLQSSQSLPKGDVELVLAAKETKDLAQVQGQEASPTNEEVRPAAYNIGPLNVEVARFKLRVSSSKLIASSDYFKAMLDSSFREGTELKEKDFVTIELLEDDPLAMMIILAILHGNHVQVPKKIDLPMLNKVAIIVDKYQWHELITPHATSYFDSLMNVHGPWKSFDKDLLIYLWIAWLFGMKDHFETLSKAAQHEATSSIDFTDERIRLPVRVLKAINEQRTIAFQKIEKTIANFKTQMLTVDNMKSQKLKQSKMLVSMVLGNAMFCSQELQLGDFALPDYAGSSVRLLREGIDVVQTANGLMIKAKKEADTSRYIQDGGRWDLNYKLEEAIKALNMDGWGLNFDDFKNISGRILLV
ncbi:uncharacterized protein LY89DRAFT_723173 [Mollisia scopiformis]|uniref:BTB domain-containing protein n=1 Tax=Mollisia scopiformis TaxID=149040 RepID=A0A194WTU9_MOLSC|nr:uncharacterized protein LY89DRAFT_723173 [Mollisia scopiformis]KUJ11366.1 hypothetical protein LY89DRAFT_723173 [Mollisia scopiformis]